MRRPSDYEPHRGDGKRFHVREYNPGSGRCYQVYGVGLDHICDCLDDELAKMVAAALEAEAQAKEVEASQAPTK